jgi:hypothetical protein
MANSVDSSDFFLEGFIKLLNLNYEAIETYNHMLNCIENVEDRELILQCKKSIDKHIYKINMLYKKYLPNEILSKNYSKEPLLRKNRREEMQIPKASFIEEELNKYFF